MIIYEYESECPACKETFMIYTYLRYKNLDEDVELPYQNWYMQDQYLSMHPEESFFDPNTDELRFPVSVLGNSKDLDDTALASNMVPHIKRVKTRLVTEEYCANICPYCNQLYGSYHILCDVTDKFLKPNKPMDIFCEI